MGWFIGLWQIRMVQDFERLRTHCLRTLTRLGALITLSMLGTRGILDGHTTCLRNVDTFGSLLGLLLGLDFPWPCACFLPFLQCILSAPPTPKLTVGWACSRFRQSWTLFCVQTMGLMS
jgi:hypothetical protein